MNRFALLASFVLAGVMLGGCPETARCPEGQVRVNRACVPMDGIDGGGEDGGIVDAGPDGGPCGECPATARYCVVDRDGGPACSECDPGMGNTHCAAVTDRPVCDPETERCVECTSNADCTDPAASRCNDANECEPCAGATDCEHVMDEGDDLAYCESIDGAARCVECTLATEDADCGSFVCDPATLRCSNTAIQDRAGNCQPCISDSHCIADHSCVPLQFDGADHGSYCLRNFAAGVCTRPFSFEITGRTTLSGVTGRSFCGIKEDLTTCEAVLAFGTECPTGMDTQCAAEGAVCGASVGGIANVCTYRCEDALECPGSRLCPMASGYCGGPS